MKTTGRPIAVKFATDPKDISARRKYAIDAYETNMTMIVKNFEHIEDGYFFTKSQLLEQRKQDFAAGQELDDDRDEIGFKFDTFEDYLKSLEESGE